VKPLNLLHVNEFEVSAPRCPTHYCSAGNGGMLDTVVYTNVRLSQVIVVSGILESHHLPIAFHLLDLITSMNLSDPVDKFTDWE
jgi:hypothetical protein